MTTKTTKVQRIRRYNRALKEFEEGKITERKYYERIRATNAPNEKKEYNQFIKETLGENKYNPKTRKMVMGKKRKYER